MVTGILGLLFEPVGAFSIFLMTKRPSMIRPKTTCFLSKKSAFAQVMKNWQPFVFCPEFAIDRIPGESCFMIKFSSSNDLPYIEEEPVPSLLMKSPPWIMKSLITLWKVEPLYPRGTPSLFNSPVQNCLKFSAVLGTMSAYSSIKIRPISTPPTLTSKNTTGLCGCLN